MNKAFLGIIGVVIVAGIAYALVTRTPSSDQQVALSAAEQAAPAETDASVATTASADAARTGITAAVLAQHSSQADCWTIVSGKVYDVTSVISTHPGGQEPIVESCGKDGTSEFMEMKSRAQDNAMKQLEALYKGDFVQ